MFQELNNLNLAKFSGCVELLAKKKQRFTKFLIVYEAGDDRTFLSKDKTNPDQLQLI